MGYAGKSDSAPVIFEGLKHLEYRGYDSAGIASLADGHLLCRKDVGKLPEVESKQNLLRMPGKTAIGHVRWATHGGVNQINAHPHLDCQSEIAVVHNGIIENFQELKQGLNRRHRFISDVDSEVIPHLIADYMHNGSTLPEAVKLTADRLKGPYAFLAISSLGHNSIVAACNDMPLIIGLGNTSNFAASDVLSFPAECNSSIQLESGEIAIIDSEKVTILDREGREIHKPSQKLNMQQQPADAGKYPHFMLKEIMEQPWAIRQALLQDRESLDGATDEILKAYRIVFSACGTSRHAALLGRYLFSSIGQKFSEVVTGSEFKYFSDSIAPGMLVIAISQSGETADILDGVRTAHNKGARVLSVVNRRNSQLTRLSDRTLYLNCGSEVSVAATKSFTAQLTLLYLLAFSITGRRQYIESELRDGASLLEETIPQNMQIVQKLAEQLKNTRECYFIARASNLHIASEAALKLKEIAYVHSDGMAAGELKHGTLALIEKGTPVIAICPHDYTFTEMLSNVEEARARGAFIIGVSDKRESAFDEWIEIPTVPEVIYPMMCIAPLQLFAYYSALARGLDPDKPRNLAKSVTVR
jgi:glucosamine--fructose-6-phosphate aminotransferase (isomerizing)